MGYKTNGQVTGGRAVKLKSMSLEKFVDGFNGLKSAQRQGIAPNVEEHMIRNLDVPLFNGYIDPTTGARNSTSASMAVNFAKYANIDPDLAEDLGVDPNAVNQHTARGNTGKADKVVLENGDVMPPAPVGLNIRQDASNGGAVTITPVIDMRALANESDKVRNRERTEVKGLPPLSKQASGRLKLTTTYVNAKDSVAAMSRDRLNQNMGLATAQHYILTASTKQDAEGIKAANAAKPSGESIGRVTDLYMKTFEDFVKTTATKPFNGVQPKVKDEATGEYKTDKTAEPIAKTKCHSLADMGIKAVRTGDKKTGPMTLVVTDPSDDTAAAKRNDPKMGLRAWSNAFNKIFSQEANATFAGMDHETKIANRVGLNAYSVDVRDPYTDKPSGLSVVQCALTSEIEPYGDSITKSVECAMHQTIVDEQAKAGKATQAQCVNAVKAIYGDTVLKNTADIAASCGATLNQGAERSRETAEEKAQRTAAAKEATAKQIEAIKSAAGIDGKENEGKGNDGPEK